MDFRNTSEESAFRAEVVEWTDTTNQFWTGTNGSRCSSYGGALGWSFASDGHLVVTFGGSPVNP